MLFDCAHGDSEPPGDRFLFLTFEPASGEDLLRSRGQLLQRLDQPPDALSTFEDAVSGEIHTGMAAIIVNIVIVMASDLAVFSSDRSRQMRRFASSRLRDFQFQRRLCALTVAQTRPG